MKESNMQTFFGNYLKKNFPSVSTAYELKICKGNSLPFDAIKEHQIKGLKDTKDNFLYHKISDMPIFKGSKTRFTKKKPFDCLCLVKAEAYVVIWFYRPKKSKVFYLIDIDKFIEEKNYSKRKSLTLFRTWEIAEKIIRL